MRSANINPALVEWSGLNGLPRFEAVRDEDFAAAFDVVLAEHDAEIEAIANNPAEPDFANTIERLETAGDSLSRVSSLFWNRAGANTNEVIQALERDISPKMSRHFSRIGMNVALFARVDGLWEKRKELDLTVEQGRVLERHWKGFVRAGAKLAKDQQERLAAINERLASLGAQFGLDVPVWGYTLVAVVFGSVWTSLPFAVLMIAGALQGTPDALVEAAKDAGASTWRVVWQVLLPMAATPLVIATTFTVIGVLGSFTVPYFTGPNAPTMLGVDISKYFQAYNRPQQSTAMAFIVFAFAAAASVFYLRSTVRSNAGELDKKRQEQQ